MCGRYTLVDSDGLYARFRVARDAIDATDRFNVAPSQHMPVVIREPADAGANRLTRMQWGLVPGWSQDPAKAGFINARIEGILAKPSFRGPIHKKRCLVPAGGFYEWKKEKGGKVPWLIRRRDHALFAFAGIYDEWHGTGGEIIESCAILTTRPNSLLAQIHDRMPVILDESLEEPWLQASALEIEPLLETLAAPFPAEYLEAHPVSTRVNSPVHDSRDLLEGM